MILSGWKEIARYMGRGLRTVQRWEHYHGLPVARIGINRRAPVNAVSSNIDDWLLRIQRRQAVGRKIERASLNVVPRRSRNAA
jgi:hypothetical protein